MHLIVNQNDRRVWLAQLPQDGAFVSPCLGEGFAALIAVHDAAVASNNRSMLCDALVRQGLRNGVCWGYDCSGWDDALDWAYLATDPDHSPSCERFVMTSWFENDPLEEAVFYFLKCTRFDEFQPRDFVALLVGGEPEQQKDMAAAILFELAEN